MHELNWEYVECNDGHWKGSAKGMYGHIQCRIYVVNPGELFLTINIGGYESIICKSLENAKLKAQRIFTCYIFSHII